MSVSASTTGTAGRLEAWRLFFPSALLLAPANVLLWLAARDGFVALPGVTSSGWHGSEMVFGYAFAVMAGYLLPALPVTVLAILWGVWLAGRLLVLLPPAALPAPVQFLVAAAFPLSVAVRGAGRFGAIKRLRNLPFPLVMVALALTAAAALAVQAGLLPHPPRSPAVLAATIVALLIMLMGGRLVPTATIGALRARGLVVRIVVRPAIELTLFLLLLAWVASDAFLGPVPTGVLALAAGATLAIAMGRWHLGRTLHDPLVWPLHAGFVWLVAGCLLLGLERLGVIAPQGAGALHALTAGGIGTVTLAMMVRVTRYRTGMPGWPPLMLHGMQLILVLAVLLRVGDGWVSATLMTPLLWLSAACWTAAYLLGASLVIPAAWRNGRRC